MWKVLEISKFQFSAETFSVPATELEAELSSPNKASCLSQRGAYHPVNPRDTQTEAVNIRWQQFQFQKLCPWTIVNTENTHSKNHVSCIFDLNLPFGCFQHMEFSSCGPIAMIERPGCYPDLERLFFAFVSLWDLPEAWCKSLGWTWKWLIRYPFCGCVGYFSKATTNS